MHNFFSKCLIKRVYLENNRSSSIGDERGQFKQTKTKKGKLLSGMLVMRGTMMDRKNSNKKQRVKAKRGLSLRQPQAIIDK